MWLSRAAASISRILRPVSRVAENIGLGVLAAMMFLIAADVLLRYCLNRPILGSFDISEYMMGVIVSFGLAYCAFMKGHVSIDLLVSRLGQRRRAVTDAINSFLGFGILALMAWQCFRNIKILLASNIVSSVLHIPAFPFAAIVAIGITLFALVLLIDFLNSLSQAVRK